MTEFARGNNVPVKTDFISREEALAVFGNIHPQDYNAIAYRTRIKKIPAADVRPVVRGEWIVRGQDIYCSVCKNESGYNPFGASSFSNFCPNCGADMRKEEENVSAD